jgi:hypothetical protein
MSSYAQAATHYRVRLQISSLPDLTIVAAGADDHPRSGPTAEDGLTSAWVGALSEIHISFPTLKSGFADGDLTAQYFRLPNGVTRLESLASQAAFRRVAR